MAEAGPPDSGGYPGALMGVIAHLRQAMLDAEYHHKALEYFEEHGGPRPPFDPALDALHQARTGALPTWWEADDRDAIHRVLDLADEFGTSAVIVGGREAARGRSTASRTSDAPVVLRVDFPKKPEVPSEEEYRKKDLKDRDRPLRALQHAKQEWDERVARRQEPRRGRRPLRLLQRRRLAARRRSTARSRRPSTPASPPTAPSRP